MFIMIILHIIEIFFGSSLAEICNRYLISIKSSQRSPNSEINKRVGKNRIQSNVNHGNSNVIIFIDLHLNVSTLKINLYLQYLFIATV